jgi:uncharacterized membrane protein
MIRFLVLLHLSGVIVWVGGMAFMMFCLRPVAAVQLPPSQRVALLAAVMGRFLGWVGIALLLIWGSGLTRFMQVGSSFVPPHWHAMAKLGAGMTVIFLLIALRFYPRLKAAVAAQDWPAGGTALETMRRLVMLNLVLGCITVALAVLGA